MGHDCFHRVCSGCCCGVSRREFVKGCGVAAIGGLAAVAHAANEPAGKKVRVGLVFMSDRKDSWPYPGFDVRTREREILNLLTEGCPQVDQTAQHVQNTRHGVDYEQAPVATPIAAG